LVQRRNDSTTAKTAKPGEKPKEQPKTEKKTKNRENQKETKLKGSENFSKPGFSSPPDSSATCYANGLQPNRIPAWAMPIIACNERAIGFTYSLSNAGAT
jgi:hypothetical protein